MSNTDDARAFELLEKAIFKAQEALEKTQHFQPFLMLLTDDRKLELYENKIEDTDESYRQLEQILQERIKKKDIDIMVLVADTEIPDNVTQNISNGIRLHLEEKSQINKVIGARFLYVPYELVKVGDGNISAQLHMPIPVGLPAEYIR